MTPEEAFAEFADSLSGQLISHVWRGYGSAVFIEFGALSPRLRKDGSPGHPEGEASLQVEWSWRIEDGGSIRCGSWSDEELWEPAFDLLRGAHVERCELFGALPEVALFTSDGLRFLSFSTTDGQPQWDLIDRRGSADRWFSVRDGKLHLGDGSEPAA